MSQDFNTTSRKARRAGRGNRSRPVLVNSTAQEQDEQGNETNEITSSAPVQELPPLEVSTPAPTPPKVRKLPGFLPALGKSNDEAKAKETKDIDPAQARIARATRKIPAIIGKSSTTKNQDKDEKPVETKPARPAASTSRTSSASSGRPASAFKTRYIFGMVLYLLCANFIGVFETSLLQSYHLDSVLTQFNLFGGIMVIRTSTLAFLATLVIILVILARLDLIPRSLGAATGASSSKSSSGTSRTTDGERPQQPTMRQGVKGEDDDLYQQYRSAQRRQKK